MGNVLIALGLLLMGIGVVGFIRGRSRARKDKTSKPE